MSSLEPQTSAKARIHTTKGVIDVELWAKETPITSRIFLTNILNQKFNGWLFNRILPNFIVQCDGNLNQEPFEDEFNTRIRFNRRGFLASVNLSSRNSNTGKFFITLKETPELNHKNTIFGKVVGDSIFNIVKISEGELSEDGETPSYPVKIIKTEVLVPFFEDLRKDKIITATMTEKAPKKLKKKKAKVKLNLGDEDEEEDGESERNTKKIKMRSAHELLDDKRLSKEEVKPEEKVVPKVGDDSIESEKAEESQPNDQTKEDTMAKQYEREKELQALKDQIAEKQSVREGEVEDKNKTSAKSRHSAKADKQLREMETLKMLKSFKQKIGSRPTNETAKKDKQSHQPTESLSDQDDDFDNLDDSDSDSDLDLYAHSLKFEDNVRNKDMANEDLLITIDDSKDRELKKRRNDNFYKNEKASSILKQKRAKR